MPPSTNVGPTMQGAAGRGSQYAPSLRPQTKTPMPAPTAAVAPVKAAPKAAPVAPTPSAAVKPLTPNQAAATSAANSNSSLQQYLDYTNSNMGRTAQSMVDSMTAPIIAGYTAQQKAGDASIVGSTQTYVDQLGGIASKAEGAYTKAEGQQSALDTALGSALQGGDVGAAASRLTQALTSAGQNTASGVAAQAAANSTGASVYASGSASLSQLFAQGANQTAFDAQQPGLARNAGIQALTNYNAGLTAAEQSAVQSAQDKLPQIMSMLQQQEDTQVRAYQNDQAQQSADQKQQADAQQSQFDNTLAANKFKLATQQTKFSETAAANKANQPKIYGSSSTGYFALTADGKNVQLTAPGAKAPKVFGSASAGYYTLGSNGQTTQLTSPVPKAAPKAGAPHTKTVGGTTYQWNGSTWAPAPGIPGAGGKGGGKTPQLTALQVQKYKGAAATVADNAKTGFTDSKGVVYPAISAADALKEMRREGVPDAISIPAINRAYGTKFNPKGKLP